MDWTNILRSFTTSSMTSHLTTKKNIPAALKKEKSQGITSLGGSEQIYPMIDPGSQNKIQSKNPSFLRLDSQGEQVNIPSSLISNMADNYCSMPPPHHFNPFLRNSFFSRSRMQAPMQHPSMFPINGYHSGPDPWGFGFRAPVPWPSFIPTGNGTYLPAFASPFCQQNTYGHLYNACQPNNCNMDANYKGYSTTPFPKANNQSRRKNGCSKPLQKLDRGVKRSHGHMSNQKNTSIGHSQRMQHTPVNMPSTQLSDTPVGSASEDHLAACMTSLTISSEKSDLPGVDTGSDPIIEVGSPAMSKIDSVVSVAVSTGQGGDKTVNVNCGSSTVVKVSHSPPTCHGMSTCEQQIVAELFGDFACLDQAGKDILNSKSKKCGDSVTVHCRELSPAKEAMDNVSESDDKTAKMCDESASAESYSLGAFVVLTPKTKCVTDSLPSNRKKKSRPSSKKRRRHKQQRYETPHGEKVTRGKKHFEKKQKIAHCDENSNASQYSPAVTNHEDSFSFVIDFQSDDCKTPEAVINSPSPGAAARKFAFVISASDLSDDSSFDDDDDDEDDDDDSDFYDEDFSNAFSSPLCIDSTLKASVSSTSGSPASPQFSAGLGAVPFMQSPFTVKITVNRSNDSLQCDAAVQHMDEGLSEVQQAVDEANQKWAAAYEQSDSEPQRKKRKVQFEGEDSLATVHCITTWADDYDKARRGPWEQYARDRERFQNRIRDVEKSISYCLQPDFRQQAFNKIYG